MMIKSTGKKETVVVVGGWNGRKEGRRRKDRDSIEEKRVQSCDASARLKRLADRVQGAAPGNF